MPNPAPNPSPSFDPLQVLADRFRAAIAAAFPDLSEPADPLITASKQAALGDFQSNAAMPLAKKLGQKPRDIAAAIVARLDIADIAEPVTDAAIAGPGFINVRLRGDALASLLESLDTPGLGVAAPAKPEIVVVDLMGVNLAKQMHVGHIRSPIIGDAIARTFERLGNTVIRQNHVGDWGLPIAMVIAKLMADAAAGKIDLDKLTLDQLDTAYRLAQAENQRDTAGLEAVKKFGLGPKAAAELEEQVAGATEAFTRARQTLIKLQSGDAKTLAVWQKLSDVTMAVCIDACRRMGVNVTQRDSAGESSYADELPGLVADLESRGIAEHSDGALVVRLEDPRLGAIREPCLVRKSDGGYLYATTDIAAIRRRVQKLHADRIIYAIDARQNLHMRQVYGASRKAGYATNPITGRDAVMEHAAFGSVTGPDGRPLKTRSGENIKLADLLEETVVRAVAAVRARAAERGDDIAEPQAREIAEAVGIAALKYADLSNDRMKDYAFSFDRMLAFEGNTGPYLLYALVRVRSIFRKAAERGVGAGWETAPYLIAQPAEKTLALTLLRYPAAIAGVAETLEPHRLCQYLYDLAGAFSTFFDACPVLTAPDEPTRLARLRVCGLTARILEDGLRILGIPTLERM